MSKNIADPFVQRDLGSRKLCTSPRQYFTLDSILSSNLPFSENRKLRKCVCKRFACSEFAGLHPREVTASFYLLTCQFGTEVFDRTNEGTNNNGNLTYQSLLSSHFQFNKFPSMHCLNRQTSSRSNDHLMPNNFSAPNSSTTTCPASGSASPPNMCKNTYLVVHNVNNTAQQMAINLLEDHNLHPVDGFNPNQVCVWKYNKKRNQQRHEWRSISINILISNL